MFVLLFLRYYIDSRTINSCFNRHKHYFCYLHKYLCTHWNFVLFEKINLTLYKRLLLLVAVLELITGVIVFFGFSTFFVLGERNKYRNAETVMYQGYSLRSEFSKTRNIKFVNEFNNRIDKIDEILSKYVGDKDADELILLKSYYKNSFKAYTDIMIKRGLNENLGVEGDFRNSVHNIEKIVKQINNDKLHILMLEARRREKDYIMRKDKKYIELVSNYCDSLAYYSSKLNIPLEAKTDIIKLSQIYFLSFKELSNVFTELDRLEIELVKSESKVKEKIEVIVNEKSKRAEIWQSVQIVVIVLSILIGIILSLYLARSIASRVNTLRNAALRIAGGELETQVDVSSNDEIGDLAKAFNTMAENIKASNQTIVQQNMIMSEQNDELKELTSDLQETVNNLSMLSAIGQSITSSLKFDELFSKLYANLSALVDVSAFGIALYNDSTNCLDYSLTVKQSEQKEGISVSVNDDFRLDIHAFKNKTEVFIDDIYAGKELVNSDYKWIEEEFVLTLEPDSRSAICLPVIIDNDSIGVLTVENNQPGAFKPHHVDTLRNISSYLSIAVINAKAYDEITKSHEALKTAQVQLIQAEKLASLGQLTTGIAHEIKNPLNFINNFSEGTVELCTELIETLDANKENSSLDIEYFCSTLNEMSDHLNTIKNNGKRIDRIVKSMMEHARGSSGELNDTNINNFAKEYTKLAYNGFRGQYKSFNAQINFETAENEPHAYIRQQDISRVITNLVDNACYSMMKKAETLSEEYYPELILITKENKDLVEIIVKDNGLGVPQDVIDKVFNPFFTTKPTGEGTGLGLSLSYDIVTQGHNGKLEVKTEVGKYAEFVISLPKNKG